jgi:hypothetical protein
MRGRAQIATLAPLIFAMPQGESRHGFDWHQRHNGSRERETLC